MIFSLKDKIKNKLVKANVFQVCSLFKDIEYEQLIPFKRSFLI